MRHPRCVEYKLKCNIIYNIFIYYFIFYCIILDYNCSYMFRPSCRAIFRLIFEEVECKIVLYVWYIYYILVHSVMFTLFTISMFNYHASNKSPLIAAQNKDSLSISLYSRRYGFWNFFSVCPLKSLYRTVVSFHYLPLRLSCIVTRCDVQGVQLKSGPYFNPSSLFTKIYNTLYYTTNLYLQ